MITEAGERKTCPYVGLQPFEEADYEFFFGREREQRIIISNLLSSPLTILYGSSGVGKSSVLKAGVLPQLFRDRPKTPVVLFRDWASSDFQSKLIRACIDAVWDRDDDRLGTSKVDQPKPAETLPFDEVLRACAEAAHETVFILFDQFEEYFLYHPKSADPQSFEAQFARAVNRDDVDASFLVALRDDGLSKLDRFQERIPNLLSNRLRLNHLDGTGAEIAIRRPLEVWNAKYSEDGQGMAIEDELVEKIVKQVKIGGVSAERHGGSGTPLKQENSIEAPFLQLVMVRLWNEEREKGSAVLRTATIDRLRGAEAIVRSHLDDFMAGLDASSQAVCAQFFDHLVTPTGSKIACSEKDLLDWAGTLAPQVPTTLDLLSRSDKRILRTVAAAPNDPEATRYEIYHDVLAPAILDWRRRYVETRKRARAVELARERALRQWFFVLVFITLVAIAGWGVATWEGFRSKANQMAAESVNTMPFNPTHGLELAIKAVEETALFGLSPESAAKLGLQPTPAAEDALRQAIQGSRLEWTLPIESLVSDVAFSPVAGGEGKRLFATASKDGFVRIWDISTEFPHATDLALNHKQLQDGKEGWARDVTLLPQANLVITVADDTAYLWDLEKPGKPQRRFVHGGNIYSAMAVNREGTRLATAGDGIHRARVIKIWDLQAPDEQPQPMLSIDVGGAWIMGLAFSPDGSSLAAACVERGVAKQTLTLIYDVRSGKKLFQLPLREANDSVSFTPDGQSLVTASRDSRVRVWQPVGISLTALLTSPIDPTDGARHSLPLQSDEIRWVERILAGHGERVRALAVSADGSMIASGSADQTAKIWDTETGENIISLLGHEGPVETVKFSPDDHYVATASRDRTCKLWNVTGHTNAVTSIVFSPDGRMLATGSSDRTIKLWHLSGNRLRLHKTLRGHKDQIQDLAFHPSGQILASAGWDNAMKLWDVESGAEIDTLKTHKDQLRRVAFSPDGAFLISTGADGVSWLFNLQNDGSNGTAFSFNHEDVLKKARPLVHNSTIPTTQVSSLAVHPQGKSWASGGWDGKIQLWDYSGNNIGGIDFKTILGKTRRIQDIAFSPDGKSIAVLIFPRVYVLPVEAFDQGVSESVLPLETMGTGYCNAITFKSDNQQLAVACNDASVRIYDTAGKKLVKTVTVHKNGVRDVAFSPDGTQLATASLDKTFHISPLAFSALYREAIKRHKAISWEREEEEE